MNKEYIKNLVESYIGDEAFSVKENSTLTKSVSAMNSHIFSDIISNYWLDEVYTSKIAEAHRNRAIHLHDLGHLGAYCQGHSLPQLIREGIVSVNGKTASAPAKHLSTMINQMAAFIGIMSNEFAGAQAYNSVDTLLAPFVREDNLTYEEVKDSIQSFIFQLNQPTRWSQAPFSNISLDVNIPEDLAKQPAVVGGKFLDYTYAECQKEADMINKAILEVLIEGDGDGRILSYPVVTFSISKEFDWSETELNRLLFTYTAKFGGPYFANYVNSKLDPRDIRSLCPLSGDTEVLIKSSKGISIRKIKDIYKTYNTHGSEYSVWTQDGWKNAIPTIQPVTDIYKVKLSNGDEIEFGENHLQPVRDKGVLQAKDLQIGDWLPYNLKPIATPEIGSYELGYAIGAYAGDGSHAENAIIYSLDAHEKDDETEEMLVNFWNSIGFPTTVTRVRNLRSLRVNGGAYLFIKDYIDGTALDKTFSRRIYSLSRDSREGILAGFRATDGARACKRLYTSSPSLRMDLIFLLNSLGRKHMANYVDTRDGRLGPNPNYRIDYPERLNYSNLYKTDDKFTYYSIVSITREENRHPLYCFEVDNDDHIFMLANGLMTHNCRLSLDLQEIRENGGGGYFGAADSTGSIGVVTLNLPQLAYRSKTEEEFFSELDRLIDLAALSLDLKRKKINELLTKGLYPYTSRYLGHFNNHFSTIGINGMNEAILNADWLEGNIAKEENKQWAIKVVSHIRHRLPELQQKHNQLFNLEATPAESTAYRFAKHDKANYPNIITAGDTTPYYTNSTHLPVGYTEDIFTAMKHQSDIATLYNGGTVFHAFLAQEIPDWKTAMKLTKYIAYNTELSYFSLTPTFSICRNHGYISGKHFECPTCGEKTEVYSRITGYYRPLQNWNDGKVEEFKDRQEYEYKARIENFE